VTAEELIEGLRERGYVVMRAQAPGGWVIIPRLRVDDPIVGMLRDLRVRLREFQPEQASRPEHREYEAMLSTAHVKGNIWEAAA
jgi:hypothetical protein